MTEKSMTLRELQDSVRNEIDRPEVDYSPTNTMMELSYVVGNILKFGLKKRLHKQGIGKDDAPVGLQKAMERVGQALWLLGVIAERNGFTLDDAREAAHQRVLRKDAAQE